MATVKLEHIRKKYPEERKKKIEKTVTENGDENVNLQVTEEGVIAVQDFNIEIQNNEFVVLVGPSGCGKTTTLRMIAGLEEITDGNLYIDDKWINDVPPKDRDIAMVFQNYALYPHMTVAENIGFSLKISRVNKAEIKERVDKIAEILDIQELLNRKPKALSGGQRQRVAIARALIREPKVILMDEPLSNLDAKLRNQTRSEIIKLRDKTDCTFIYVTHDQVEAMTLGDRIVVMKDGFVQQIGTPSEVFNNPNNLFVAEFIGSPKMNIIDSCSISKINNKYYVKLLNSEIELSKKQNEKLLKKNIKDTNIIIGIRPAHIEIGEGKIQAIVVMSELMGTDVYLHVTVENIELVIIISAQAFYDLKIKNGDNIKINFDETKLHLFDSESKLRIV